MCFSLGWVGTQQPVIYVYIGVIFDGAGTYQNHSKPTIDGFSYLEVTQPKAKKLGNCMAHFEVAEGTRIGWRAILQETRVLGLRSPWFPSNCDAFALPPFLNINRFAQALTTGINLRFSQWTSYTSMIFLFSNFPWSKGKLLPWRPGMMIPQDAPYSPQTIGFGWLAELWWI